MDFDLNNSMYSIVIAIVLCEVKEYSFDETHKELSLP